MLLKILRSPQVIIDSAIQLKNYEIMIETSYPKPTIKALIPYYKYRDLSTIFIKVSSKKFDDTVECINENKCAIFFISHT